MVWPHLVICRCRHREWWLTPLLICSWCPREGMSWSSYLALPPLGGHGLTTFFCICRPWGGGGEGACVNHNLHLPPQIEWEGVDWPLCMRLWTVRAWVDHLLRICRTLLHLLPLRGNGYEYLLCMHLPPLGRAWVPWVDPCYARNSFNVNP